MSTERYDIKNITRINAKKLQNMSSFGMNGAMTVPPMMIAFGICFFGFSMSPAIVQMTSNPNILKMMTEIKERLSGSKDGWSEPTFTSFATPASVPCTRPVLRAPPPKTL